MDMLSQTPPPSPQPSKDKHWPDARAVRGMVYGVPDPIYGKLGDKLVVMLNETWLDYGTQAERMRRDIEAAGKEVARLTVLNNTLTAELADLRTKHHNLRAAEKRRRQQVMGFGPNK
jgi:hypothetical protein